MSSRRLPELISLLSMYILKLLSDDNTRTKEKSKSCLSTSSPHTQCVQVRFFIREITFERFRSLFRLMFTVRSCFRISIAHDEMILVFDTAHIWTEHNGIRRFVGYLFLKSERDHHTKAHCQSLTKSIGVAASDSNFTYAPPHSWLVWNFTSYWTISGLAVKSNDVVSLVLIAWCLALV